MLRCTQLAQAPDSSWATPGAAVYITQDTGYGGARVPSGDSSTGSITRVNFALTAHNAGRCHCASMQAQRSRSFSIFAHSSGHFRGCPRRDRCSIDNAQARRVPAVWARHRLHRVGDLRDDGCLVVAPPFVQFSRSGSWRPPLDLQLRATAMGLPRATVMGEDGTG